MTEDNFFLLLLPEMATEIRIQMHNGFFRLLGFYLYTPAVGN
jgi:hypothetical protein